MASIALAAVVVLVAVAPASAGSYETLRRSAHVLHSKVERRVSDRAAGRDIAVQGVRVPGRAVRRSTRRELIAFKLALKRMLHPPVLRPIASLPTSAPTSAGSSAGSSAGAGGGGGYCGAYQFDAQTWRSVGGSGTACGASRAEQDARAQLLMQQRGRSPWPVCGRGGASLAQIRQCENGGSYR